MAVPAVEKHKRSSVSGEESKGGSMAHGAAELLRAASVACAAWPASKLLGPPAPPPLSCGCRGHPHLELLGRRDPGVSTEGERRSPDHCAATVKGKEER